MSGHTLKDGSEATISVTITVTDFELVPWRIEGERCERIEPVPGTWTLAPEQLLRRGIKGLISCPNCRAASLVTTSMGSVVNGVNELEGYACRCGFRCNARLTHWDTKKLFCIAYEILDKDGFVIPGDDGQGVRKEYTHAESRQDAAFCFIEVRKCHVQRFRVIDCAPVIGFFGSESDKDQKVLTV